MEIFSDNSIKEMINIYINMIQNVERLEELFPSRKFTLDGHLIGSMGEAIANNCYGINLDKPSNKSFDGITLEGKLVQIKLVQQDKVLICCEDYDSYSTSAMLLVLYINKVTGNYYEVYNGPFNIVWNSIDHFDRRGYKHISVNKLMALDKKEKVNTIAQTKPVPKMQAEFKNKKSH